MAGAGKVLEFIQELVKRGVSPNEIKRQTGYGQLVDGSWAKYGDLDRARAQGYVPTYHGTKSQHDELDMEYLDLGLHTGTQQQANLRLKDVASQNRGYGDRYTGGYEDGAQIQSLMVRPGRELEMEDVGDWRNSHQVIEGLIHNPKFAKHKRKLEDWYQESVETAEQFADSDEWLASAENKEFIDEIRDLIRSDGYDSIRYVNQVENLHGSDAGLTPAAEAARKKISDRINQINTDVAERNPPPSDPSQIEEWLKTRNQLTDSEAAEIERLEAESMRIYEDPASKADNTSLISLDLGNVRSSSALFDPAKKGLPNLLASAAPVAAGLTGLGAMGQSGDSEAGIVGSAFRRLFKSSDGYTFAELPDGRIESVHKGPTGQYEVSEDLGFGSYDEMKEFMEDDVWQIGDEIGALRSKKQNVDVDDWNQFRAQPDQEDMIEQALQKQRGGESGALMPVDEQYFKSRKNAMDSLSDADKQAYESMLVERNNTQKQITSERMKMFDENFQPLNTDEAKFAERKAAQLQAKHDELAENAENFLRSKGVLGAGAAVVGLGALGQSDESEAGPFGDLVKAGKKTLVDRYHGTPHTFDEFDLGQMGSGEGAQAYGWGAYLAGRRGTAEFYRDSLTNTGTKIDELDGEMLDVLGHRAWDDIDANNLDIDDIDDYDFSRFTTDDVIDAYKQAAEQFDDEAVRYFAETLEKNPELAASVRDSKLQLGKYDYNSAEYAGVDRKEAMSAVQALNRALEKQLDDEWTALMPPEVKGNLYKAGAPSDEYLLDWDNSLADQPSYVRDRLLAAYGSELESYARKRGVPVEKLTGKQAYYSIKPDAIDQREASEALDAIGIPGSRYLDGSSRRAGEGTRNYVIWDQDAIGRTTKIGALGGLAAGLAATPDDAEAGPLASGARRLIDPRFTSPVGAGSPRKGLIPAIEGMPTEVEMRQMDRGTGHNLYDFEGHPYILTQSDRSAAGGVLTGLQGKSIDPVDLRGGRDFMFDEPSAGQVWASDPRVVDNLYKRAQRLKNEYGKDPLLLPYSMAPTGIDFATMPLDTMINYARSGMSKTNKAKLDRKIKKIIPEWGGVDNPASNELFRDVPGDKRKAVADLIDKEFRDVPGGLSISEARAATSDAAQYVVDDGSLRNIGRIDTSRGVITDSGHPTYIGGLPGEGVGTLKGDYSVRPFMEERGRVLSHGPSDIRSLSMNPSFGEGIIDESLLKRIYGGKYALAPATAVLAGLQSPDSKAAPSSTGTIEAAKAPWLQAAADYMDQVELPVIGNPFEGLSAWARGAAYQDDDRLERAAIGALDLM